MQMTTIDNDNYARDMKNLTTYKKFAVFLQANRDVQYACSFQVDFTTATKQYSDVMVML